MIFYFLLQHELIAKLEGACSILGDYANVCTTIIQQAVPVVLELVASEVVSTFLFNLNSDATEI